MDMVQTVVNWSSEILTKKSEATDFCHAKHTGWPSGLKSLSFQSTSWQPLPYRLASENLFLDFFLNPVVYWSVSPLFVSGSGFSQYHVFAGEGLCPPFTPKSGLYFAESLLELATTFSREPIVDFQEFFNLGNKQNH